MKPGRTEGLGRGGRSRGRRIGSRLAVLALAAVDSRAWWSRGRRRSGCAAGLALLMLLTGCGSQPEPTVAPSMLTSRERARIYARCMADRGWEVGADESDPGNILLPDGGIPASQSDAYERDGDECDQEHGLNIYPPPTEAEALLMYRHYLTTQTCLIERGFTISAPPTEGTFVAGYLKEPPADYWNPYLEVPPDVPQTEWDQLVRDCPQNPVEMTG